MDKRQLTSGSGKSLTITSTGRIFVGRSRNERFQIRRVLGGGGGGGRGDRKWAGFNVGGEEGTGR